MIVVESAGITDVGKKRTGNEDSLFYDDEMGLYVVADGMGGHKAGEVASKIVADTLRDQMTRFREGQDADKLVENDANLSIDALQLNSTIQIASRQVFDQAQENTEQKGMGSTVSAVYLTDHSMIIGNVGDSPIYLIRDGEMKLVSVLHTMMAEYEAMAPDGAKNLSEQFRHMITRGMGLEKTVKPDVSEIQCLKNDMLILSSDGLTDMVEPEKIHEVAGKGGVDQICQNLVDLANENGGKDNITVIVLKIVDRIEKGDEKAQDTPLPKTTPPPRKTERLPVSIDTDDASFSGFIHNLDLNGAFVETSDPFSVGSEIYLTVSDPEEDDPFMIIATVAKRRSRGIDVTFENLTEKKKGLIRNLIEKL